MIGNRSDFHNKEAQNHQSSGFPYFHWCERVAGVPSGKNIKRCWNIPKENFAGKFRGYRVRTVSTTRRIEETAGYCFRGGIVHYPKDKTQSIPTQVAKASVRFEIAVHTNIFREKFVRCTKTKLGIDSTELANGVPVLDDFLTRFKRSLCMNITPSINCTPALSQGRNNLFHLI